MVSDELRSSDAQKEMIATAIKNNLGITVERVEFQLSNEDKLTIGFGGGVVQIDLSKKPSGTISEDFVVNKIATVINENLL